MWDAFEDLVLGSACVLCGSPGRALCRRCDAALPRAGVALAPDPVPDGLVPTFAVGPYDGDLRTLVLALKERRRFALARPLGRLLAAAVLATGAPATGALTGGGGAVVLVPVPSHPAVVRERQHDPLLAVTRHAAGWLRREGVPAEVARLLRVTSRPQDSAGLDAAARARNVAGKFAPSGHRAPGTGPLVLVDDVLTTGATLREVQRVLERQGLPALAGACVAATRRHGVKDSLSRLPAAPGED